MVTKLRRLFGHPRSRDAAVDGAYYAETTARRRIVAPHAHLCAITDVGRERNHNEDTFAIADEGRLLVVADGLGGHAAGGVASALAVDTLVEYLAAERLNAVDRGEAEIEKVLIAAFEQADVKVREAAQSGTGRQGMGTTLIAARIRRDQLHTCHVGDVRCYVRNAEALRSVTQDHSIVGLLTRAGQLTPEEARVHPEKGTILQAIGTPMVLDPEVHSTPLHAGDLVLLCSDGLWEALSDEEINAILAWEGSMRQRATQLVDRANEAGGPDNITVVLYEHVANVDAHVDRLR